MEYVIKLFVNNKHQQTSSFRPLQQFLSSVRYLMPIARAIRLLNPSSLTYGFRVDFVTDLQDLLDYAHPRFYAALVAIAKEKSKAEKKVMQLLLQREVVSVAVDTIFF